MTAPENTSQVVFNASARMDSEKVYGKILVASSPERETPTFEFPFECREEDQTSLESFAYWLGLVAQGLAHMLVVTPEHMDDYFRPVTGENVFTLDSDLFYRAFLVVLTDQDIFLGEYNEQDNQPASILDYQEIVFNTFPAAAFLDVDMVDFLLNLERAFGNRVRLLRGDTVHEVWQGRFDETDAHFLYDEPPKEGKGRFGLLHATTQQWQELIYPQTLNLRTLMENTNWLSNELESFDQVWEIARNLLPPSPEQMKLDLFEVEGE